MANSCDGLTTPYHKKQPSYKILHRVSDLDGLNGTWNVMSLLGRFTENNSKRPSKVQFTSNGSTGGRMGQGGSKLTDDHTSFCGNVNANHHLGEAFSHTGHLDQQLRGQNLLVIG
jgi:hypothetical protein